MVDQDRIREVVNRHILLTEVREPDGPAPRYVRATLRLTDGRGEAVMEISATSLRARRDLLELVLVNMVNEAMTCARCGTQECLRHDPDLCTVVQVMRR